MNPWTDLKFTQEELERKSITALADRPELSAAEMKERLDSGDIRIRFNALLDRLETNLKEG
jgi:hypothetical protein